MKSPRNRQLRVLKILKKALTIEPVGAMKIFQLLRQGSAILIAIGLTSVGLSQGEIGYYEQLLFLGYTLSFFWVAGLIQGFLSLFPTLKYPEQQAFLTTSYGVILGVSLLLGACCFIFQKSILWFFIREETLPYFELYLIFLLVNLPALLLESFQLVHNKSHELLWFGILGFGGQLVVVIAPLWLEYSFVYSFYGLIFIAVFKHLWLLDFLRRFSRWILDFDIAINWLRIASPLMLYAFIGGLNFSFDSWLVNIAYQGKSEVFAIFRYGAREFPLAIALANAFNLAMLGKISTKLTQGMVEMKEKSTRLMHQLFPVSILLMLLSQWLFEWVFGAEFRDSAAIFNVYLLILISRVTFPQTLIIGKQDNKVMVWISILELIVNIVASIILIRYFGLVGIAWGSVIAYATEKLLAAVYVQWKYGISFREYTPTSWYYGYSFALMVTYFFSG